MRPDICSRSRWLLVLMTAVIMYLSMKALLSQQKLVTTREPQQMKEIIKLEEIPLGLVDRNICSQKERIAAIKNFCKAHPSFKQPIQDSRSELDIYRKFFVDKKHKILFCQIPKAAGRYWRTMFVRGSGVEEVDDNINTLRQMRKFELRFLHTFKPYEQKKILSTYFKVMTIRHPLDRAVSAYIDKFTTGKLIEPLINCIKHASKNYRAEDEKITIKKPWSTANIKLTWGDFTSLLTDNTSPYNPHWDSAYHLCHPCAIEYDYVIRTETMDNDSAYLLNLLNLDESYKSEVIHARRNFTYDNYAKVLNEYKDLPRDKLDKIVDIYRDDMALFGYNFDVNTSLAICGYDRVNGGACC